jgi:hypothetical protein
MMARPKKMGGRTFHSSLAKNPEGHGTNSSMANFT